MVCSLNAGLTPCLKPVFPISRPYPADPYQLVYRFLSSSFRLNILVLSQNTQNPKSFLQRKRIMLVCWSLTILDTLQKCLVLDICVTYKCFSESAGSLFLYECWVQQQNAWPTQESHSGFTWKERNNSSDSLNTEDLILIIINI